MPWKIGADKKWLWDPTCEECGGSGNHRHPIDPTDPVQRPWWEKGADWWCVPCWRCKGSGTEEPR